MTTAKGSNVNCSYPYTWKRPEGPPRIWRVVDGRKKTASGKIPKYSIQEVPKDLENDVIDFMTKYFLEEEAISINMRLADDPVGVRGVQAMWRDILHQGVSVVALEVNPDPSAKPVIGGINMLYVGTPEDKMNPIVKFHDAIASLYAESNAIKTYGVDRYLGGLGLIVHPSLRGQGIGEQLLRARDDIGRAYQIPISDTVFSGKAAQILAARVGFEVLAEKKYSEILDDEGKVIFPKVTAKSLQVTAKRLY